MPELGKATYYLVVNSAQFNAAMAEADAKAAASANGIGRSFTRAEGTISRMSLAAGASTTRLATTAEKNGLRVAHAANAGASSMTNLEKAAITAEKSVGGAFGRMARYAKTGIVFGLAASLYIGIKKMKEHAAVAKETEHFVTKLGNAHYTSAKKVQAYADRLSSLSGIEDDSIQHASNILLTFRGIAPILDRATQAAVDMSHTFGQDAAKSAVQLGKALFDPVKGATALRRIGISLSQSQKDLIKTLEATGKHAQAQEIIMHEVEAEVGGAAVAYGKTLPGMLGRAKHAFEQFSEVLTRAVMPALMAIVGGATQVFELFARHATTTKILVGILVGATLVWVTYKIAVKAVAAAEWLWTKATAAATIATKLLRGELTLTNLAMRSNPAALIITALVALGVAVIVLYKKWKPFHDFVVKSWSIIRKTSAAAVAFIIEAMKALAYGMLKWFTLGIRGILSLASHLPFVGKYARRALDGINATLDALRPNFGNVAKAWELGGEQAGQAHNAGIAKGIASSEPGAEAAATANAQKVGHATAEQIAAANKAAIDAASPELMSKAQETIDKMVERMKARLSAARSGLSTAFGRLAELALQAFDAKTQAALTKFQQQVDAAIAKISAQGAALTPAEAALKQMDDSKRDADLQKAKQDALSQLATAQSSGDRSAILQAQQALADAEFNIRRAALEKQAELERIARDKATQERIDQYNQQAEQERINYESQRALQRYHLELWLKQWEAYLTTHPKQWRKAWAAISRVLGAEWGPGMRTAAKLLGTGFRQSLLEAVQNAGKAALRLGAVMQHAQSFGRGLAQGIVAGLGGLEINLYYTIYNQVVAALKKARQTFGVHSPSTWTAEQLGEPLGQGVVVGFNDSTANMLMAINALRRRHPWNPTPGAPGGAGWEFTNVTPPDTSRMKPMSDYGVKIEQHITQPNPDPHALLLRAKFAADAVFA